MTSEIATATDYSSERVRCQVVQYVMKTFLMMEMTLSLPTSCLVTTSSARDALRMTFLMRVISVQNAETKVLVCEIL